MKCMVLITCFLTTTTQAWSLINFNNTACTKFDAYPFKYFSKFCYHNPNVMATTPQMIEANGYKCETHFVTTEDGYILTMHRVVDRKGTPNPGRPVLFFHGIMADSGNWVGVGNRSLPFVFFELGYDPWLGNLRGNQYSRNHIKLKDSDFEFWDYSFENMVNNDFPANVEKVVNETRKKLIFVGHSLGGALCLGYSSENPGKMESWVEAAYFLGSVPYIGDSEFYRILYKFGGLLGNLLSLKINCFLYHAKAMSKLVQVICTLLPRLCLFVGRLVFGETNELLPEDFLTLFSVNSISTSIKVMMQVVQYHNSQRIQKFDFGTKENLKRYGHEAPPLFYLENITQIDVNFFCSRTDPLMPPEMTLRAYSEIGSSMKTMEIVPVDDPSSKFSHVDFLYGKCLPNCLNLIPKVVQKYPPHP